MEAEEGEEGGEAEGDSDRDTPRGETVEVTCLGGGVPPLMENADLRDSAQNVRTCCCRESLETSRITTTGRNWTDELQTMIYGSVVRAGLLLSQQAGTSRSLER